MALELKDSRQLTQVVFSVTMRTYVWMFQQSANSCFSFQLLMIYINEHGLYYATVTDSDTVMQQNAKITNSWIS